MVAAVADEEPDRQSAALTAANTALALMGLLNADVNHELVLELGPLPEAATAEEAVRALRLVSWTQWPDHRYPPDTWRITTEVLPGSLNDAFGPVLYDWMFGAGWSPRFGTLPEWGRQAAVEYVVGLVRAVTGPEPEVRRLVMTPDFLGGNRTSELVLSGPTGRWLVSASIDD